MRIISLLLTLLTLLIVIAFTLLNAKTVEVNYLIGSMTLPLAVIMLITLLIGTILSGVFLGFSIIKLKAQNKWLESKLRHSHSAITPPQP